MTEPRKKPKRTKQTRSQEGAATKPKKKQPKQTAHRRAASDPEVHELLEQLRKRWKRASGKERRDWVAQLLSKGCKLRGIADDIHQPESVVRYYSEPEPSSPAKEKPRKLQTPVPAKGGPKQIAAAPVVQRQGPSSPKVPSAGTSRRLPPFGKIPLPKLPPRPLAKRPEEREENLETLRSRLTEIIVGFARAKWGIPEMPVTAAELPGFFTTLMKSPALARPWIRPVELPERISIKELFLLTEPKPRPDTLNWAHKAKWLAIILLSLYPDRWSFDFWIHEAERQLIPPPEPVDLTVDEFGRPLKPYEIRLRQMARSMSREGRKPF